MRLTGTRRVIKNKATEENDLGFGTKICSKGGRLIQRDGSFNVHRTGLYAWTPYQTLVEMSWPRFFLLTGASFFGVNGFFALLFLCCGGGDFSGLEEGSMLWTYAQLFFFSVQTFTTVGYGAISPVGFGSNMIATMDAFVGLLAFALATGLVFARFAKPKAQILFSKQAVIAPYHNGMTSFQFRIVNLRNNNILNLEAKVAMTWIEKEEGNTIRRFANLPLERNKVSLFPLNWTIVHPIDVHSPLHQKTAEDLKKMNVEFIILVSGYDDTFAQQIHDNASYLANEIVWGARFEGMYYPEGGRTILELDKINSIEMLPEVYTEEIVTLLEEDGSQ